MPEPRQKLPVPGPWQPAVRAAMADLAHRETLPAAAIAVTRVAERAGGGLEVWLLAGGRTRRYLVRAAGSALEVEPEAR
jgi:hypothetical protein